MRPLCVAIDTTVLVHRLVKMEAAAPTESNPNPIAFIYGPILPLCRVKRRAQRAAGHNFDGTFASRGNL